MIDLYAQGIKCDCIDCRSIFGIDDEVSNEKFHEQIMAEQVLDEGIFSWSPCPWCGCEAGDRYIVHHIVGSDYNHEEICFECYEGL